MIRKFLCLFAVLMLFGSIAFAQYDYYDYYDYDYYDDYCCDDCYYGYYGDHGWGDYYYDDYYGWDDGYYQYYTDVAIGIGNTYGARVSAVNPQNLNVGSSVSGFLGNGQEIWYRVTALNDGILTVEISSDTDTYLEAYDFNSFYITENDDGGEGLNAKISMTVTRGAVYFFKLRGYSSSATGPYSISVTNTPFIELPSGRSVSGRIESMQNYWYRFIAPENGLLVVQTSGNTDTILVAYDPDFYYISYDDDSGDGLNARIMMDVVAGGTYYFDLRAWSDNEGPYSISANYTPLTELIAGRSISGFIESSRNYIYRFTASETGVLTVQTTGSTDTFLTLYDEYFNYITEDDDSGAGLNALIEIDVTRGTTYFFDLRAYGSNSGPYVIMAEVKPYPTTQLFPGTVLDGYIESGRSYRYSVVAPRSGILVVETSGSTDTTMTAYDEDWDYLAWDDDSGVDFNAKMEITAVAGRTYYFEIGAWGGGEGWYSITARVDPFPTPIPLPLGTAVGGYINNGVGQWYSIRTSNIPGGTIVIETTGNDVDTFMEVYDASYNLLASDDDSGEGLNAMIQLHVQANTTYIVRIRGYSTWANGPYRIFANYVAFGMADNPYIIIAGY